MYPDVFLKFASGAVGIWKLGNSAHAAIFLWIGRRARKSPSNWSRGKSWCVKLLSVSDAHPDGTRTIFFELNGQPREVDRPRPCAAAPRCRPRPKADPSVPGQVGSPIPGAISSIVVDVGEAVKKGDRLPGARSDEDAIHGLRAGGGQGSKKARECWRQSRSERPAAGD